MAYVIDSAGNKIKIEKQYDYCTNKAVIITDDTILRDLYKSLKEFLKFIKGE